MAVLDLLPRARSGLAAVIALAVFVGLSLLRMLGGFEAAELALYDHDLRRAAVAPSEAPPITLVLVREDDIRRHGHPLPDEKLRELIETVLAAGPRALAIDLYRDLPVPPAAGDDPTAASAAYHDLGEVVLADPRVVMITKFAGPEGHGTPPPQFLQGTSQVGFADLPVDDDGRVRRGLLYLWDGDTPLMSISMHLASRYLTADGIHPAPDPDNPDGMLLGETPLPPLPENHGPYVDVDNAGYQFLLDYRFGDRPFDSVNVSRALEGDFDPDDMRDRVVLVGTAAQSVKDSFLTPIRGADETGTTTYGVEVHAHAVDQLIRYGLGLGRPLESAPAPLVYGSIALFAIIGAGLGIGVRALWLQASGMALVLLVLVGAARSLIGDGLWIPVIPPATAALVGGGIAVAVLSVIERVERRQIEGLFSRFQGRAVADDIWLHRTEFMGEQSRPVARTVTLTALMSDLEGYTAASEVMQPEQLMAWINEYMSTMAELVERHGGVVDDYAGDGIKANFGFPVPSRSDAEIDDYAARAVRCALEMGERMQALNERWAARGLPEGRCRVGICTGPAVVGCIGSAGSLKYTSVGDTVNTAARLEGFAKDAASRAGFLGAARVLVGQETWRRTRDAFAYEDLGAHALKGKQMPVQIYRVRGAAASNDETERTS